MPFIRRRHLVDHAAIIAGLREALCRQTIQHLEAANAHTRATNALRTVREQRDAARSIAARLEQELATVTRVVADHIATGIDSDSVRVNVAAASLGSELAIAGIDIDEEITKRVSELKAGA